jgi:hypothetical protein
LTTDSLLTTDSCPSRVLAHPPAAHPSGGGHAGCCWRWPPPQRHPPQHAPCCTVYPRSATRPHPLLPRQLNTLPPPLQGVTAAYLLKSNSTLASAYGQVPRLPPAGPAACGPPEGPLPSHQCGQAALISFILSGLMAGVLRHIPRACGQAAHLAVEERATCSCSLPLPFLLLLLLLLLYSPRQGARELLPRMGFDMLLIPHSPRVLPRPAPAAAARPWPGPGWGGGPAARTHHTLSGAWFTETPL